MEKAVRALEDQTFYKMQALPFAMLPGLGGTPDENVLRVRYDAMQSQGEPRAFAIFMADDLAPILDRIRFPEPIGIGLPGSDMFFMEGPDGLALYVDTDMQEELWINILDEAHDAGLDVVQSKGDIAMICRLETPFDGMARDIDPPSRPGYAAAGFHHVPIEAGIDLLQRKARMEGRPDGPTIPDL